MKISIIGLGVVGNAMYNSFLIKSENTEYIIYGYDKYKNGGIGRLEDCVDSDIIITALPTLFDESINGFNHSATYEVLDKLNELYYNKIIIIKSTVEPEFTEKISNKYVNISFIHNPEFLFSKTSFDDFHNQKYIILGKTSNCSDNNLNIVKQMYELLYNDGKQYICTSNESECMKLGYNTFCSVKIQYFNELYLLCNKIDCDFEKVKELMFLTGYIKESHTQVPGTDGQMSFGGACLPKDCKALLSYMKDNNISCEVLESCVSEMKKMRN